MKKALLITLAAAVLLCLASCASFLLDDDGFYMGLRPVPVTHVAHVHPHHPGFNPHGHSAPAPGPHNAHPHSHGGHGPLPK